MYQYQVTSTLTTTHYKNAIEDEQQDVQRTLIYAGDTKGSQD